MDIRLNLNLDYWVVKIKLPDILPEELHADEEGKKKASRGKKNCALTGWTG